MILFCITRCRIICAIVVLVACCGCSRGKTTAAASGYKALKEKPKSSQAPATRRSADGKIPAASKGPTRRDDLADGELVQRDVRTILAAVYDGDIDLVFEYTHPRVIELLGGEENAKVEFSAVLSKLKSSGMKLESLKFPNPPTFLNSEANEFAIVPTLSIISVGGKRVESLNYQVGNREIGTSKWTYIEGSRINQQNVKEFFLDFPMDFEFPKSYRKKL